MFPFGNMNRLHTQKRSDLEFLVKTLIAGPYPFSMHEIIEISDEIQIQIFLMSRMYGYRQKMHLLNQWMSYIPS